MELLPLRKKKEPEPEEDMEPLDFRGNLEKLINDNSLDRRLVIVSGIVRGYVETPVGGGTTTPFLSETISDSPDYWKYQGFLEQNNHFLFFEGKTTPDMKEGVIKIESDYFKILGDIERSSLKASSETNKEVTLYGRLFTLRKSKKDKEEGKFHYNLLAFKMDFENYSSFLMKKEDIFK